MQQSSNTHSRATSQESSSKNSSISSVEEEPALARLNGTYDLIRILGEGSTSTVWLARHVVDPSLQFAIKFLSQKFVNSKGLRQTVDKEVDILTSLDHDGIIKIYEYNENGVIEHNNELIYNQVYIVMEYVNGPVLFDVVQKLGATGEDIGRFMLRQMIEQLEYINSKGIVHRDIKLENIIIDEQMNLKLADFGFATNDNIDRLNEIRGTQSYMAPEVRSGRTYDGRQTDIFSMGVVLFSLVVGLFPFATANPMKDKFYQLLQMGKLDEEGVNTIYWRSVKAQNLSSEFKLLMQQIFSFDPNQRPTIEQLKAHPWFKNQMPDLKYEVCRTVLMACFSCK